ncbi:uncharacterized protein L3040_002319 [Drepanopeziza brunnea f. sp. 'multigermtubi']|uniref:Uncharacterized protein n=1 Tax=Marssonina brunnea f. sp. multigermtubi (strain MB_m1) TaxID=1072389 RepID=K1XGT8_MARBU|nr:uncharacterized protein MBM_01955 [Drepanopeziza brunnea f. sp. 'multigermtubi' MB_m1]EKD20003.1 hypothetical protein MBM_01955 [Drepanopeziza brunnea f. sp. 'multigermtubi' MB_m1]KAJ5050436.1 hypothetical protein L3040_002319 [Drepanopeziza brunnea f. sp. 'multigermtubi']
MGVSRALPFALGALAISSGVAMLTFDIIFAITLSRNSPPVELKMVAIVASGTSAVTVGLLLLLLVREIQHRTGAQIQDLGRGRQHTYLLAALGGVFGISSATSSAVLLGMVARRTHELPVRTILSKTKTLVIVAFIVWAISIIAEAMFLICMIIIQRKDSQYDQEYGRDGEPQNLAEMVESGRPRLLSLQKSIANHDFSSIGSPPLSERSRADSDMSSFRFSFKQVVRPISSKTKLIAHSCRSSYRPQSIVSNNGSQCETVLSIEDGFDSWDTSGVDAQSREAVASASPTTPPRLLETIPASPTNSRSGSPVFPLDLEPPRTRPRSRSYSPANSCRDLSRTTRNQDTESMNSEAHIHPLFRTDSPAPPPAATPGTMVTAAPGAGQVISDRQSIRSIQRIRSGSLPSSPVLGHSASLESIRQHIEREELERLEEVAGQRSLTPPIPDFILKGVPRNTMQVYNSRRKPAGLGPLGEVRYA